MKDSIDNKTLSLLKKSNFSIIGYGYRNEKKKDDIISKFNYIKYQFTESIDSFLSFIREHKINQIINSESSDTIVIDIQSSPFSIKEDYQYLIKKLEGIGYRIIISIAINRIRSSSKILDNGFQNSQLLYKCDLAIIIEDSTINIVKNRLHPMYRFQSR